MMATTCERGTTAVGTKPALHDPFAQRLPTMPPQCDSSARCPCCANTPMPKVNAHNASHQNMRSPTCQHCCNSSKVTSHALMGHGWFGCEHCDVRVRVVKLAMRQRNDLPRLRLFHPAARSKTCNSARRRHLGCIIAPTECAPSVDNTVDVQNAAVVLQGSTERT